MAKSWKPLAVWVGYLIRDRRTQSGKADAKWRRLMIAGTQWVVACVAVTSIVSCARSTAHTASVQRDATTATRDLVHGTLPSGGRFVVVGQRYRYGDVSYFGLRGTVLTVNRRGRRVGGSSGTNTTRGERATVVMVLHPGCTGRHVYALAFGLLRARADVAIARGPTGEVVLLRHVEVPATLGAGGVLVYAALPWVPVDILVQTRDGRTVVDENYSGLPPPRCPA